MQVLQMQIKMQVVPRIEEILSITENPKNPSLTIYLNQQDEIHKEKAK